MCKIEFEIKKIMLKVKKKQKTKKHLQFKTNPLTCYNAKNPHLLDFLLILMMFLFFLSMGD